MIPSMTRLLLVALLAASATAGPINDVCPVNGERVDGKLTSDLKLGFCCANCKGRFDRDPLATLHKLDRIPLDTCPLSGKAVGDAASTVTVAFCSGDCKSRFEKEPGKYLAKIQAAEKR